MIRKWTKDRHVLHRSHIPQDDMTQSEMVGWSIKRRERKISCLRESHSRWLAILGLIIMVIDGARWHMNKLRRICSQRSFLGSCGHLVGYCQWWSITKEIQCQYFELKLGLQAILFVNKISWDFQLIRIYPFRDARARMSEQLEHFFYDRVVCFCSLAILRRIHSSELKCLV